MKEEILQIFKEKNDFVSGQELCEHFNVSRTAIWKAVKALKDSGYEIESVTNKGYRLKSVADVLNETEIRNHLSTKKIAQQLKYFDVIDSTNLECKRIADAGQFYDGTLIVADRQDAGRGRRGRTWECPAGINIAMSLLLKPDIAPDTASMLTIVMAMAVANAVKKVSALDVKIKWPNDIIINGRKFCGILTEMSLEMDYIHYVIIGVGINVNQLEFPEEIKDIATSVKLQKGESVSRAKIVANVMAEFERLYEQFLADGDLSALMEEYNQYLVSFGKEVRVLDPKGEFCGISEGINSVGELLVRKEDGNLANVYAGEVSVRGIYGYV